MRIHRQQTIGLVMALATGLALCGIPLPASANQCGLPLGAAASAALMTPSAKTTTSSTSAGPAIGSAFVSIGFFGGIASSSNVVMGVGLASAANRAFSCFMTSDLPLAVSALPGTRSIMRLVPSPGKTMTLEWTNSAGPLPVTYQVFVGTNPVALSVMDDNQLNTQEPLANLSFTVPYYWQVEAADQFGRAAMSDVYSFSIAPSVDHFIAAPNPMHPGHGVTTFLFSMNGPGYATVDMYSLPDIRHVFSARYDGLQDGANTVVYDGRDNTGHYLANGVYTMVLRKMGANGNETERFKLVSAR